MKTPVVRRHPVVRHYQGQRICILLAIGIFCSATIQALPGQSVPQPRVSKVRLKLPPPPPGDPPGGRPRGGGGRDNCPAVTVPLTALVPTTTRQKNGKTVEDVWGLTVAEKPNFWVYSPYALGDRYSATFVIRKQNKNGESIGQIPVKLPNRPGVFKIELPVELLGLQFNQRYYWELSIDCGGKSDAVPLKIYGIVQRVELSAAAVEQIQASTTIVEKAQLYAENGIWFEALDLIGMGRQTTPDDQVLKDSWQDLLKSVELDAKQFEPSKKSAQCSRN
jgi:Domain of Unknown Function (DUF928)